ncbi:beta-N-acetylhexosaminidase [Vagococcus elongatus]|uniref:Beta-N-acetylhexosaminidase n=1 Tax=Vagococcus elongatus TaxID=180344 RepID=A0A430AZJ3_9ENTE|nr:beta-N-acetylhexosaminidase [Vagococcus elongatus]RSU13507.1 beta-N-acetylhexosaminidase [Vagococcus elongatus]
MDIKKLVGQLFVVGFDGTTMTESLKQLIHEYHIGAVILFNRNIGTLEQLKQLTEDLQKEAKNAGYSEPMLICLDQENGVVRRIDDLLTRFPGGMTLAATGETDISTNVYKASAKELASCGINWNLAPVADVNNNPENPIIGVRSFGDNPQKVADLVVASMKGMQAGGVISCLKHFPGHGDTQVDSHLSLPIIDKSQEELEKTELVPFKAGIKNHCDTIMISHIQFNSVDGRPASLSHKMVTGLLREQLGFDGVVTTDCLEMDAIAKTVGVQEGCYQALLAGCDFLMVSHTLAEQIAAMEYISEKIADKELDVSRVHASIDRIRQLKERYVSWEDEPITLTVSEKENHQHLADETYQKGLTYVDKRSGNHSSAMSDKVLVLFPNEKGMLRVEDIRHSYDFSTLFEKLGSDVQVVLYDKQGLTDSGADLSGLLSNVEMVVLCTVNVMKDDWIVSAAETLPVRTKHIVMRNPYDADLIHNEHIEEIVFTYEPSSFVLEKSVSVLAHELSVSGQMPVKLK